MSLIASFQLSHIIIRNKIFPVRWYHSNVHWHGILSLLSTPSQQLICARVKLFTRPFPNFTPYTEEALMSNSLSISLKVIRLCHSHVIVFSWSAKMCECVWGLSCLIWTPLKFVPPGMNIWTHSENFVPTVDQPHQGKSVHVNCLPRTLVVSTVAYLETEWLVFISMCRLVLHRVHKSNCAVYTEMNAVYSSARNEACTLCAAELACLNIFQKPQ